MSFTPYHGFWLKMLPYQYESKNSPTLIVQEIISQGNVPLHKKHHFVVFFLYPVYKCAIIQLLVFRATCACMHHLVFFLINFTTVCILLLGNIFAMHTCMHHLFIFFMPRMQIHVTMWSFQCHMQVFTSLVVLKTLLGGAELPVSAGTWPRGSVWVF